MKVKVKWIDAFAISSGKLLSTPNIKEFELDTLIELEANPIHAEPVEEEKKGELTCEDVGCPKHTAKKCERLNEYDVLPRIEGVKISNMLNQEFDNIYRLIREMRG